MRRRRQSILTPAKATLLMLGLGTASLMGIPGVGGHRSAEGALTGIVTDTDGDPAPEVPVALFDGESLDLLEITHTDEHGHFALQVVPRRYHVCAQPAPETGLVSGWALDLRRGPQFALELVLERGRPLEVLATDADGEPIEGAEVRVYHAQRSRSTVVAREPTDASGRVSVPVPANVHVGVFGASSDQLPEWAFHVAVPEEGTRLDVSLPRGRRLHGRVLDEGGTALEGIVVSSWDRRDGWQWNGYRLTGSDGAFAIHGGAGASELRAVDRFGEHLPGRTVAGPTPSVDFRLRRGRPLEIACSTAEGQPLPARVWAWCEPTGTWGWGGRSNVDGRLSTVVAPGYRLRASPLSRVSVVEEWEIDERAGAVTMRAVR